MKSDAKGQTPILHKGSQWTENNKVVAEIISVEKDGCIVLIGGQRQKLTHKGTEHLFMV